MSHPTPADLGVKVYPIVDGKDTLHPTQDIPVTPVYVPGTLEKANEALYSKIAGMRTEFAQR